MSTKKSFEIEAIKHNVIAGYSGKKNTMYITGEDSKVKSFIRVCNLKGKKSFPFNIAQG